MGEAVSTNCFKDFSGTIYPEKSFPILPISVKEINVAIEGDGFRAGPGEWGALSIFLELSMHLGYGSLIELGSSQGLWCTPFIKAAEFYNFRGLALGVEASDAKDSTLDFWNAQQLSYNTSSINNHLKLEGENWDFIWVNAIVGPSESEVEFPIVDIRLDNGASYKAHSDLESNLVLTPTVDTFKLRSLQEAIGYESDNSMLHIDIQGAELDLLLNSNWRSFFQTQNVIMLGTHSVEAEILALKVMPKIGFTLISLEFSKYAQTASKELIQDGEQIWISNNVIDFVKTLEFIDVLEHSEYLINLIAEKLY